MKLALTVALLVLLICIATEAKRHNNKAPKFADTVREKGKNNTLTRGGFISFDDDDGDDDSSEDGPELSSRERAEKLKILTMEGKPGWLELVKKKGKETAKKIKKEMEEKKIGKPSDLAKNVQYDSNPPSKLISDVKNKLAGFTGPLATRVKTKVTELNTKWKTMKDSDRQSIMGTLGVVASNIEKFGDAGSNPIGAVQGAVNIIGAVATFFGPVGQLASIGLSFVSSLLGLFGQGPKPRPIGEIVREQIDEALEKYRDESLTDKASGLIKAFRGSKSYLDGAAESGKLLSKEEMIVASARVPMTQGSEFIGELTTVIEKIFKNSKPSEAQKCIKYCELFAQLAGLKDMILTQMISLAGNEMENDVRGLMSYHRDFREAARVLLEPLFTIKFGQKVLPYFDPDISVITDSYATSVLDLGKYDRSRAGMYCLMTQSGGKFKDLVWSAEKEHFHVTGKPYTTLASENNNNCYWKLVPHGNHIFSIVNKKGCDSTPPGHWCGSVLSFDILEDGGIVNIEPTDGIMWTIYGSQWTM
ncbi:uncharacterized protein LOC114575162 [Exaiptasia diaphana]|uniref:Uncharacterized protein n=1 Tax=Exaiptasia diaphana TaxID=2652724 RepID=A0A913YJG3_EXADI|nr:uncharacterized protein LOC114575162 [Exaiptasia diaphana]KXJ13442.1 Toxin CrTX-A [Exaiptasia diaphana]